MFHVHYKFHQANNYYLNSKLWRKHCYHIVLQLHMKLNRSMELGKHFQCTYDRSGIDWSIHKLMEYEHNLVLVLDYLRIQLGIHILLHDFQFCITSLVRRYFHRKDSDKYCCNMIIVRHNLYYCDIQWYKHLVYMLDLHRIDCDWSI